MYEVTLKDRKYTIRQADFSTDDFKHIHQLFYKYFPKSLVDKEMMKENNYIVAEKMKNEAESIFLWAFEGLQRLVRQNFKFTESPRIKANRENVNKSKSVPQYDIYNK